MKQFAGITILIPAYMPSGELLYLVNDLTAMGFASVVVVDDGSGADFNPVFNRLPPQVVVLRHATNRGKGRALKTGLAHVYEHTGSVGVVTVDADGQHRPADVRKVAEAFLSHRDALVLGSRAFDRDVPLRNAFGNTVTRGVFFFASRVKVRDTQTGLRAFSRDVIPSLLGLEGERYEYEINMLLHVARRKMPILEVDIETVYLNGNRASHFNPIRDSAIVYGQIARFSLAGLVSSGIDFTGLFLLRWLTRGLDGEASLLLAVVGARAISSYANYSLNKKVVFRKNGRNSALKYYALAACILGANYGLLYGLNILLRVPLFWAKAMTELALFLVSYNVQKRLIFNVRTEVVKQHA